MEQDIIVSGVRPTGKIHLGNYFGAIANFVKIQDDFENCYFFIADYHSYTTHPDAKELPSIVRKTLATYLAAGLDPEKCTIYMQSDLPQIPELYLVLNMIAYKGELEKVPTFKEKIRAKNQSVNAGLLTYPVLMAADIIIHRANKVPVGKDQAQHLELTRNLVNRFNHWVKEDFFPEPHGFNYSNDLIKVPSLDGTGKMSKSDANPNNAIYIDDSDETIIKKMKKAKTVATPEEKNTEKPEVIENLFSLMNLVSLPALIEQYETAWNDCTIRFGDMKIDIAKDMIKYIQPMREKLIDYEQNTDYLKEVVNAGGGKARQSANETMKGVRNLIGINYF